MPIPEEVSVKKAEFNHENFLYTFDEEGDDESEIFHSHFTSSENEDSFYSDDKSII